jgi:hypothetical protein
VLSLRKHHDGRTLIGDTPAARPPFLLTACDFAGAVAALENRLHRLPDERTVAEELRWGYSQPALVALAQEARAVGLVRLHYDSANGTRRYAHT